MASDSGADDAAALRERVAQLEETVAEQQATSEPSSQPTASRRGLLSAAAGVAGLGALGVYSSSPASAQAAGQVGTQSEPVDVEAYDLNVQGTANGLVQNPLTGDLDADGNSLINVGAVEADKLTGSWDYVVNDGPEFVDVVNNQLTTGESVLIGDSFTFSSQIDLSVMSGIRIRSEGPRRFGPEITYDGTTSPAIKVDDVNQATIEDVFLTYVGSGSNVDGIASTTDGGFKRSVMRNVHVNNFSGDGVNPRGWQSTFQHMRIQDCDRGFICDSAGQANTIVGLSSAAHTNDAIYVSSAGGGWQFFGGEASSSGTGVRIRGGGHNVCFDRLHHENNSGPDYVSESNGKGFVVKPAGLKRAGGSGPAIDLPAPRDFAVNLGGTVWAGDGTILKLGDSSAGTTAIRGTIHGSPRDGGTNTTVIDPQSTSSVYHYGNGGPTSI